LTVGINLPSADNYQKWDVWGKALIRSLTVLFSSTQVINDVGKVDSFFGSSVPTNGEWLKCNGTTFDKKSYPVLFAKLGNTTTLPNLTSPFGSNYCVGIRAA
jgi:hypothetical protein